ncbi:MAG: nucleoside hydrolase [Piscinibacter sp.]|nr:nucleoside hydrolase [Piscinibacter sp.]
MPRPLQRDDAWYHERLEPRAGRLRVVIDTDAANEIDDPFAIAWALLSPDRLQVEAVYAAPYSFAHRRSQSRVQQHRQFDPPGVGMERSHAAIQAVYDKLGLDSRGRVLRGSTRYLAALDAPERSPATDHLIATALAMPAREPLYVVAIGCATNVANALLLEPAIAERIVVVWTSGYPSHAPHANHSFNLEQDLHATRVAARQRCAACLPAGLPCRRAAASVAARDGALGARPRRHRRAPVRSLHAQPAVGSAGHHQLRGALVGHLGPDQHRLADRARVGAQRDRAHTLAVRRQTLARRCLPPPDARGPRRAARHDLRGLLRGPAYGPLK